MNEQISLISLWMDAIMRQQSNSKLLKQKTYNYSMHPQPNWLELILHREQNLGHSTGEACWKYFCILPWFLFHKSKMDQN